MTPSKLIRKYRPRMMALMEHYRKTFSETGLAVDEDVADMFDYDTPQCSFRVHFADKNPANLRDDDEHNVDVTFSIQFSEDCDGEKGGVTFRIDTVEDGGAVLAAFSPYNYTVDCWMPRSNHLAVETRFKLFEDADVFSLQAIIKGVEEQRADTLA